MLHLFLITLAFTLVLFIGAALVVNYSKRRSARSKHPFAAKCGQSGCACTSALQTTIEKH